MHTTPLSCLRLMTAGSVAVCSLFAASVALAASGDTVSSSSSSESSSSSMSSDTSATTEHTTTNANTNVNLQPGAGTVIVEQKNSSEEKILGQWTMVLPTNEQKAGASANYTLTDAHAGSYTIFAKLPTGGSATIRVYRNENLESLVQRPQATFRLGDGDVMRIVIHYTITNVGLVSVQSDPSGLSFRLNGPNNTKLTGVTPASFFGVAEGQYQVQYDPLEGCNFPASQGLRLQAGNRIDFNIRVSCPAADAMREQQTINQTHDVAHITITSGDQSTVVSDVAQSDWFAPYVVSVAKYGILSGYKDANGKLTGEYGPGNNVTVAELAKIAHKIAGISEEAFATRLPINTKAQRAWFSPFIASAEDRGWTIYSSATVDPNRPATRAEVLVTLLQALDIPLNWQTGTMFSDVSRRTAYAGAIETAAAAHVVDGRADASGSAKNSFGPADPINRAELAKVLSKMIDTYKTAESAE